MTDPLRVLLVEDAPTDAKLVSYALKALEREIECERVEDEPAFRSALGSQEWDVVLSDWSLPTFSALAALKVLQETGSDIPFIIVSGTVGEESAVEAMRAGASDYVLKDRLIRLAPSVARALKESEGRAARRHAEVALRESEARFQRLFESGIVGIAIGTDVGAIEVANEAFLRMIGYHREDLAAN